MEELAKGGASQGGSIAWRGRDNSDMISKPARMLMENLEWAQDPSLGPTTYAPCNQYILQRQAYPPETGIPPRDRQTGLRRAASELVPLVPEPESQLWRNLRMGRGCPGPITSNRNSSSCYLIYTILSLQLTHRM